MYEKPPLGVAPEVIVKEKRIDQLLAGISRYREVDKPIPNEWIWELHRLLVDRYVPPVERNEPQRVDRAFDDEMSKSFEEALGPHKTIPNGCWIIRAHDLRLERDRLLELLHMK